MWIAVSVIHLPTRVSASTDYRSALFDTSGAAAFTVCCKGSSFVHILYTNLLNRCNRRKWSYRKLKAPHGHLTLQTYKKCEKEHRKPDSFQRTPSFFIPRSIPRHPTYKPIKALANASPFSLLYNSAQPPQFTEHPYQGAFYDGNHPKNTAFPNPRLNIEWVISFRVEEDVSIYIMGHIRNKDAQSTLDTEDHH